jgi:hypothetical protein
MNNDNEPARPVATMREIPQSLVVVEWPIVEQNQPVNRQ